MFLQGENFCSPNATECLRDLANMEFGCKKSCVGLYADFMVTDQFTAVNQFPSLDEEYSKYKEAYARNFVFDPTKFESGKIN